MPSSVKPAVGLYPGKTFKDCADCPEMVIVPAGHFRMGDLNGVGNNVEKPVHEVTISRAFAVGKYEVTQGEWRFVMGNNPSYFKGDNRPVEQVNWNEAKDFARKLSAKTGKQYRLLSEAEWEYAARAGTTTKWSCGNQKSCLDQVAWYDGYNKRGSQTHPVGSKSANIFGLHDMHGNVAELVEDCWNENYNNGPSTEVPRKIGDCDKRVIRGGGWAGNTAGNRSANRFGFPVHVRGGDAGFRVARDL